MPEKYCSSIDITRNIVEKLTNGKFLFQRLKIALFKQIAYHLSTKNLKVLSNYEE